MKTSLLHLHAPDHWVNDPNGFLYYRGQYHLFYQYFPYAAAWGTMHWGHAVSRDLVHWQHQGLALFPTIREDQNGCFSGSAVEQDGEMVLFYTGVRYVTPNPRNIHLSLDGKMESNQLTIVLPTGFPLTTGRESRWRFLLSLTWKWGIFPTPETPKSGEGSMAGTLCWAAWSAGKAGCCCTKARI